MEHEISRRFNDQILDETKQRFGINSDNINALDGFESFIFEYEKDDGEYILRIGHSRRRSPALIHAEVDWINYLADGGAGVAKAVLSVNDELVEAIDDGEDGQFLATAFVKAQGDNAHKMGLWDETLFVKYGRLLGRMHKLSKDYEPSNPEWKRPTWNDPTSLTVLEQLSEEKETAVRAEYNKLLAHLNELPMDKDSYGMIHQDAHAGNFFVDENYNITLFDFDDAVFGHFIYDIAMVMFYAITNHPTPEEQLATLWPLFMQGYQEENDLDPSWYAEILPFMKLREIDLYAVLIDTFGYDEMGHPWIDTFMNGRQDKIAQGIPYVNFEFALD